MKRISFDQLSTTSLVVDAVYEGGSQGNVSDDPLSKLLKGTGNMGGVRDAGSFGSWKWIVLYTSGEDSDWPDSLDTLTGEFIYYGDNKTAGHELHETPQAGNKILREIFANAHSSSRPIEVPPIFIFRKYPTAASKRSVQFMGLAVPGTNGKTATEDLTAVWKSTKGERFQNYRAVFTILDEPEIKREWIDCLREGKESLKNAPKAWSEWKTKGLYKALTATPTKAIRTLEQQFPQTGAETEILETIWDYFKPEFHKDSRGHRSFEYFAAWLYALSDERVVIDEVTRKSVDGGRDAIGHYKLGINDDPVIVDFALEAKCYNPGLGESTANTIGVKEVSRLISRIKHRQFGVLVTTSQISRQVYEEVRDDKHPIIFIAGGDIAKLLISKGYKNCEELLEILKYEFPKH
jgi:hypothetical protein